ncbi:transposable element Tcb1 transposase [Trichonephila clavipes]|nr:transposable element Tcb1 transposase [Trichonephila clavipes]
MNSSQHRCMNQAPASENQMQQRSLNSSLEATVGSPLVYLVGMLLNGSTSSLPNSPLQPSVTSITYGPWYTTFATSLILDGPILPHARYTLTTVTHEQSTNLAVEEMLPTFSRMPKIMLFWTSDNSLYVCITPTTVVFSEALTHPLYTLNSTAMPASFCDWLFNVKVEKRSPISSVENERVLFVHVVRVSERKKVALEEFSPLILPFRKTIGPSENHDMASHIMTDPPLSLTVEKRQSRSYVCAGVFQTCTSPVQWKPPDGARIVRHNDESVREEYVRNGGKEVKLFTSALKALQCNNRIVMAKRKHLDHFLRGRIIGRQECGCAKMEVSEELGIAQSVISRLWQRFQDDGNVSRCYSTGRPRAITPNEDRHSAVTAKTNRRSTASDTCLASSLQLPVRQFQGRLCLFSRQFDSRRTLIWRAPGTRYHQENTIERHRYGGTGWLVWGGIILSSRTDLHVQSVTMTGHIYRDVILEQHVRLFRGAMGAEFLFMDDNARPHRAKIVDECLQSENITRMDWPAYSSDLNPIEHVWDMLGRRIAARQPPPNCLPEFRRTLLDEWCNIPQDQIDNLILSMPRLCKGMYCIVRETYSVLTIILTLLYCFL